MFGDTIGSPTASLAFGLRRGDETIFPSTFMELSKQTEWDSLPRNLEDAPGHRHGNRVVGYHPNSRQHTRLARRSVETCLARTGPKQPRGSLYSQAGAVTARVGYSHVVCLRTKTLQSVVLYHLPLRLLAERVGETREVRHSDPH